MSAFIVKAPKINIDINKHNGTTTPKQLTVINSLINTDLLVFEMEMPCVYHEVENEFLNTKLGN
jgi:hypothetical protein